jgi:hypothetical protein
MSASGQRIIKALKEAAEGHFASVTIDGQIWVRKKVFNENEDQDAVSEILKPYRSFINERPKLLSLLYDIDMLPEQTVTRVGAIRLAAFCEVWKRLPESEQ